jgi:1,4-dihydroxy-6-naphthoate synthase
VKLAYSPCPNDTFVFHAWTAGLLPDAPPVEVTFADIDVTNTAAERGDFDVVKVSYAALPWLLGRYTLLPSGGALGRGCGPLVLAREPARNLSGATVAVPSERSTAYLLFRLWAAAEGQRPARIDVVPFAEIMPAVRDGAFDAGLIIHEARFTFRALGLHQVVDLGQAWEDSTGLPIPLGAIVAKRSLGSRTLTAVADAISDSVAYAWKNPDASAAYVREHAQEMDPEVMRQHIGLYVNDFTAGLGEAGYRAIRVLLDEAAERGVARRVDDEVLAFPAVWHRAEHRGKGSPR